jgi:hypothetical protein
MVLSYDRQSAMYSNTNPMFKLANLVTSTEEGKNIAVGLTYELRVPFFLGAIKQGHEELVKWMTTTMGWSVDPPFLAALNKLCTELEPYEPDMVQWIIDAF